MLMLGDHDGLRLSKSSRIILCRNSLGKSRKPVGRELEASFIPFAEGKDNARCIILATAFLIFEIMVPRGISLVVLFCMVSVRVVVWRTVEWFGEMVEVVF